MKLFAKYNRINITASVIIFIAGTFAFYFALRYALLRQLDDTLKTRKAEIKAYVKEHDTLPEIVNTNDQWIVITPSKIQLNKTLFSSEKVWNPREKEKEWIRKIQFVIPVNNQLHEINIYKSEEEMDGLIKLIVIIAVVMIALILLASYFINRVVLKKLWQPFYHTITTIGQYKLAKQQVAHLPDTGIDEFTLLNHSVNRMTDRVQQEYQVLKDFTGNAAHEMQTPLAVISSHADSLMQDETLLQQHGSSIGAIEQSVNRLSKLNQALLLLAKIEHGRFELNRDVNWDELLKQKINEWQELINARNLKMDLQIEPVTTVFHPYLADIVISNLLNNSIRYNLEGGFIGVKLTKEQLSITNTSVLPAMEGTTLFNRFFRYPGTEPDGNGLGLSIVKQVCDLSGYTLGYEYANERHVFTIKF